MLARSVLRDALRQRIDAELAELLSDSAVDSDRIALTRGTVRLRVHREPKPVETSWFGL